MLELFKRNHLFNSLLLLPYALVVRAVTIIFPFARIPGEIFGSWGSDFLATTHQWDPGEYFITTFLVFIQAVLINRLFIKQSMLGEINLFPGFCYVLITSIHPSFISLSSVLVANTTLLIALGYLFDVLKKEQQEETRFMAGWWLGVSALIYTPYLVLLIYGLISMSILKTLKLKDIFQYLSGYISPFFIGWLSGIIFSDKLRPGFLDVFDSFGMPSFTLLSRIPDIIAISVMGLLLLISILGYSQIIARKNIHAQKKIDTMYALVLFSLAMAFFPEQVSIQFGIVLLLPLSLFMAILLRMIRHQAVGESIHFILFVAAVLTQVLLLV